MSDHFTETSRQGFEGSRLANSFAGLVIGPLLVIGAIVLLWWNEGRAVQAIVGLKDAASQVVEAQARPHSRSSDLDQLRGGVVADRGTLVMLLGFAVFLTPLSTMAAVIPLSRRRRARRGRPRRTRHRRAFEHSRDRFRLARLPAHPGNRADPARYRGRLRTVALAQSPRACGSTRRPGPGGVNHHLMLSDELQSE